MAEEINSSQPRSLHQSEPNGSLGGGFSGLATDERRMLRESLRHVKGKVKDISARAIVGWLTRSFIIWVWGSFLSVLFSNGAWSVAIAGSDENIVRFEMEIVDDSQTAQEEDRRKAVGGEKIIYFFPKERNATRESGKHNDAICGKLAIFLLLISTE